jgi:ATP-binding cassette, subfamily B, bacterial
VALKPSLRRLLSLARPHARLLVAATLAGAVSLGCGLSLPLVTEHLVNNAIIARHHNLIWPLALIALVISVVRAMMNFLRRNLSGEASVRVEAELRARLFRHLQGLPISFHDHWESGQLLARATSDLDAIRMFVGFALAFLGFLLITAIAVIVAIAVQSAVLAALALALAVPFLLTAARFNRIMEDISAASRQSVGDVATVVAESAAGIRILKAFGVEAASGDRLERAARHLRDVNIEAIRRRALYVPVLSLLPNMLLGVVLGVGGFEVINGSLSVGSLVAVIQYLFLLVVPMRYVGWMLAQAQQAVAASERLFEILDTQPAIANRPDAGILDRAAGEIRFDSVTVIYPGASVPALREVSFVIRPGETVAIVGATGSGKSTVAALVPRFIDPDHGRVEIDRRDVRDVTLASLRGQIGVVFDEPVLFSATVAENIAFGWPDAATDDIVAAATAAGAHKFIIDLPAGYDTRVGEQGFSLSGGQRQRLALARALLGKPRILILDDPLSSVDVRTEAEIEANLAALFGSRTTILIAHRASTVAMADRVVLLDEGRVVATGKHADLLAVNDVYRRVLAADLEIEELAT